MEEARTESDTCSEFVGCSITNCPMQFHVRDHMREHVEQYHGVKPTSRVWNCTLCTKSYFLARELKPHLQRSHGFVDLNISKCRCKVCKMEFESIGAASIHLVAHHNFGDIERSKDFQCKFCDKSFSGSAGLNKHFRSIHANQRESIVKPKDNNYEYQCEVCNKKFKNKHTFCKHVKRNNCTNQCELCNKTFGTRYKMLLHSKKNDCLKPNQCEVCHKVYQRRSYLLNHIKIHESTNPKRILKTKINKSNAREKASSQSVATNVKVTNIIMALESKLEVNSNDNSNPGGHKDNDMLCQSDANNLTKKRKRHNSETNECSPHGDQKRKLCNDIDNDFNQVLTRKQHQPVTKDIQWHSCDICPYQVTTKIDLLHHFYEIHNKSKPKYQCDLCSKWYQVRDSLYRHYNQIHQTLCLPEYKCQQCPSRYFRNSGTLGHHILKQHNVAPARYNYSCKICGRGIVHKKYVLRHLRLHGDPNLDESIHDCKPWFSCNECKVQFHNNRSLDIHINLTHKVNKNNSMHFCNKCSKRFYGLETYKNHIYDKQSSCKITSEKCRCEVCHRIFKCFIGASNHIIAIHGGMLKMKSISKKYQCKLCSLSYQSVYSLRNHHQQKHFGSMHLKNKPKTQCAKTKNINKTSDANNLKSSSFHQATNKSKQPSIISCKSSLTTNTKECSDKPCSHGIRNDTTCKDSLKNTYQCVHCNDTFPSKLLHIFHLQQGCTKLQLKFACPYTTCDKVQSHAQSYIAHLHICMNSSSNTNDQIKCIICSDMVPKTAYTKHFKDELVSSLTCQNYLKKSTCFCQKEFYFQDDMQNHLKTCLHPDAQDFMLRHGQ